MNYAAAGHPPFGAAMYSRGGLPPVAKLAGMALAMRAMHRRAQHLNHGLRGGYESAHACEAAHDSASADPRMSTHGGPFGRRGGWPSSRGPFANSGQGGPGGSPFPFGPPWGGAPKARRGDVRAAILAVLADGPRNGYQVIGEIAERSGGAWRPSPGSVYPTLSQLEDEGLVKTDESAGRRLYDLTEEGRAYVTEHPAEMAAPWESFKDAAPDEWHDTFSVFKSVAAATWQVMHTGTDAQRGEARRILADARRDLYRVLGEGAPAESDTGDETP